MKKWIKYLFAVLLIGVVISVSLLLPPALSDYNAQSLIGQVHFDNTGDGTVYRYTMSEEERLELVAQKNSADGQVIWNYNQFGPTSTELSKSEAVDACLRELEKLCEKIAPEAFEMYTLGDKECYADLVTIYDLQNPGRNVSIWQVNFLSDTQIFTFSIDAESGTILDFSVPVEVLSLVDLETIVTVFANYSNLSRIEEETNLSMDDMADGRGGPFYGIADTDLRIAVDWYNEGLFVQIEKKPAE